MLSVERAFNLMSEESNKMVNGQRQKKDTNHINELSKQRQENGNRTSNKHQLPAKNGHLYSASRKDKKLVHAFTSDYYLRLC